MAKAIDILKAHQSTDKSMWQEQAQWHVDNWGWLKHSAQIALRTRSRMVTLGLTQKDLAERMGCSQQYVSLILKGKENLTLETISRLECVLGFELISNQPGIVDGYEQMSSAHSQYLSDSVGKELNPDFKTITLVDGYKSAKKRKPKEPKND